MGNAEKALFVIDMLNDFADSKGKLYCATAEQVVPKIKRVIDVARANGIPVFYLNDAHEKGDRELEIWGEHAMKGTWEAEVVTELAPYTPSEIVEKRWYSGFTETNLDERLKKLGVKTVYITGMHTNICDRHTSYDAFTNGYDAVVISDATGTFTPEEHNAGLEYLKTMYAAKITTADEAVKHFESGIKQEKAR